MNRFEYLVEEFQKLIPFKIRFKDESELMQVMGIFATVYSPEFLSRYTTVLGNKVYFPDRTYLQMEDERASRILAHEVVHLLDAERITWPLFYLTYLFPQIFALGVFSFPWIGAWSLLFLLFLLPIPSPIRLLIETRAYAIDVLTAPIDQQDRVLEHAVECCNSWGYFKMWPFPSHIRRLIMFWMEQAEKGKDPILLRVLLIYEMAYDPQ